MKTKSPHGNYDEAVTDEQRELETGLRDMANSDFQGLPDETVNSIDDHWNTPQAFAGGAQ